MTSSNLARGECLLVELVRLSTEADTVYRNLVLPSWADPKLNHFTATLYGYMMSAFARIDLASMLWRGTSGSDSKRMVDFMCAFLQPNRVANALAANMWRHKLMHTASPQVVTDRRTGHVYRWLLHWGDEHLPREQHFRLQSNGVLDLSLFALLDDLAIAFHRYVSLLGADVPLQQQYDRSVQKVEASYFQSY
jgi:hypothetical protein